MPFPALNLVLKAIRNSNDGGSATGNPEPPASWDGETLASPVNYAYNYYANSTTGTGDVYNTDNQRIEDWSANGWRVRTDTTGTNNTSNYTSIQLQNKLPRHNGDGGKYYFYVDLVYGSTNVNGTAGCNALFGRISNVYGSGITGNDADLIAWDGRDGMYIDGAFQGQSSEWLAYVGGDYLIIFVDFDNDLVTFSVNNTLATSYNFSGLGSGWYNVGMLFGINGDLTSIGGEATQAFDLAGNSINVPAGTSAGDWNYWTDYDEWLTKYTPLYFGNDLADGWTLDAPLGGSNTLTQGADGSVVFTDQIESPSITLPATDNYVICVQHTHQANGDSSNITDTTSVTLRKDGVDTSTTLGLSITPNVSSYIGQGFGARQFSGTEGEEITFTARATSGYTFTRNLKNCYLIRREPAGVEQPAPVTYDPLTLDVTPDSITDQVANDSDYTTEVMTANTTGGSGQLTYQWTSSSGEAVFSDPTGVTTTATYTSHSAETIADIITCTVNDSVTAEQVDDTVSVTLTFGYTDDYKAYWEFEEDDITGLVVADLTVNDHDLTMQEGIVLADGANGTAIDLNASQYGIVAGDAVTPPSALTDAVYHINADNPTSGGALETDLGSSNSSWTVNADISREDKGFYGGGNSFIGGSGVANPIFKYENNQVANGNEWTLALWVKMDEPTVATPDGAGVGILLGFACDWAYRGAYIQIRSDVTPQVSLVLGDFTAFTGGGSVGNGDVNDLAWHYCVWSYDDTTGDIKRYYDGQYVATANVGAGFFVADQETNDLSVLGRNRADEAPTNVAVDDVKIFNRVLTDQEVADEYNAQYQQANQGVQGFVDTEFTLSTWIKADSTVIGDYLFQSGDTVSSKAGWSLFRTNTNAIKLTVGNNTGLSYETDWTDVTTVSNVVNNSAYRHIAVVVSSNIMRIYVDGVVSASKAWTGIAYPETTVTSLGSANGSSPFNGDMDMTKYFDRALSSVEIDELYNEPKTPATAPEPLSVAINPASVIENVFPNEYREFNQTAVASGGSGNYIYTWTKQSGTSGYDITAGGTTAFATMGGTGFGENFYVFRVTVTDTSSGETAEATTSHFINWGAV